MRLSCEFKTEKIPMANRMMVVSLIKEAIKKVNKDYYEKIYSYEGKNNKQIKNFCFAVMLKDFNINKDIIEIKDKIIVNISTSDYEFGINLYNGMLNIKEIKYKNFTLNKIKISLLKEKFINNEQAVFKTLSPICIKNASNEFISPEDENYGKELNYIVNKSLEASRGYGLKKELIFEKVLMKKVVVKEDIRSFSENTSKNIFYVNAYSGIFKLTGDVEDLNCIYQLGLGFRRSQGFGMVEIV